MIKLAWKDVEGKTNGVKTFGTWRVKDQLQMCQIKRCKLEANWMTTVKKIGLVFLCFGHGEDS